jgi:colicin import membrane protein
VKLSTSEPGMVMSALGHATFLVVGLLAFSSPAPLPENEEAIAVEVVDPSALNQVTRGERQAEKVEPQPVQRAERQSETVERKEAGEDRQDAPAPPSRPAELKTADTNAAAPLPPPRAADLPKAEPQPAPPEPVKPPQPAQAKAEPKPDLKREELAKLAAEAELQSRARQAEEEAKAAAQAKAEAEAQAKQEAAAKAKAEAQARAAAAAAAKEKAEALAKAKAEAEAEAKIAAAAKAKQEAEAKAKREAEIAKNFNPTDIAKLLQSKEQAQSSGSAAPQVNRTASLGTERGAAQKLSPSLRAQLVGIIQDQLLKCWNVPIALANARGGAQVVPSVRMKLNTDGSLAAQPGVINSSSDPLFRVAADSALTATRRCAPLRIPAQFAAYYDDWRDVVVNFDARDVL